MPNSPFHVRQRNEGDAIISVQMAVQDFLASTEAKHVLPKTRAEYTSVLTEFATWCETHSLVYDRESRFRRAVKADGEYGPVMLHQVNDQAVQCFLEHIRATHKPSRLLAEKLSSYTFALYVKDIKRFLNWCVLDEEYCYHVMAVTVQRIKKPKIEEVIKETFSLEQIEALFAACEKEESEHLRLRDRAIVALLLDSGIRATELVTLTIGNVDLDARDPHIRIFGKGQKWGEVGMGEQARRLVQKYIRMFREPTIEHRNAEQIRKLPLRQAQQTKRQFMAQEPVFVSRAGKPLTRIGLLQLINRLGEWAGIEDMQCSPHIFRHTFAANFIRQGGDIYRLSKLLRHSSLKVTEEYLKSLRQSEARKGAKSVLDNL